MALAPGTRLGPYEILALIGSGGMGEVYRARDPRLKRDIAIKIVPEAAAADPERRARLEREAQSLAGLSHPNIVTIHSVEELEGALCLTMEYVDGKPLSDLIVKGGLPLTQLLTLAIPLADAISAAHQKGITHRDLKPANVMVGTDGRVKVLDFGLAKLIDVESVEMGVTGLPTAASTGEGRILGTVAYMSPEQAEGRPVDHRSDIFSVGVMLYEMATGVRPFAGETTVSTITSILRDTPRPITELNPAVPRDVSRIVRRCLVKDADLRYQSAKDLRNDLDEVKRDLDSGELEAGQRVPSESRDARSWATRRQTRLLLAAGVVVVVVLGAIAGRFWLSRSPVGGPIDSIAVLPFVNGSGSADADYLSDGLAETLTDSLAQIRTLRVIPRSLAARYQGQTTDPRQAGRDLNVRAIVTGRVVQRGDRVTVQAQLIDVGSVAQLWGEQFDRGLADVLSVQADLSKAIADHLRLQLTASDVASLATRGTRDAEAYQLYLKGWYAANKRNESLNRATDYFEQAIARDPSYASAYAGLADSVVLQAYWGYLAAGEAYPKAIAMAKNAIALDDRSAAAHAVLGATSVYHEWNWAQSEQEFQRALTLDPNNAVVHSRYASTFLLTRGRFDDAIAEHRRAEALDPLSPMHATNVGGTLTNMHRYDEAIAEFKKAFELEPDLVPAHLYLAKAYWSSGRGDLAIAESRRAIELGSPVGRAYLAASYAAAGRKAEAVTLLNQMIDASRRSHSGAVRIAIVFALLGQTDQAMAWLEKAYKEHEPYLVNLNSASDFDSVRADPRFQDLVRRIGIPSS